MKYIVILMLLLFATSANAAPPTISLFLTPQESREAATQAAKSAPAGQGDISLGAILFFAPNDWTLWLQGERWTPETSRQNLRIISVTADEVRLRWRGDGDKGDVIEKQITLNDQKHAKSL